MHSVAACADIARSGGLFGMPTETVYGLAADADNAQAVAQIFATKGRPADHPLIVHLAARSHDDGVHADATLGEGVDHYCPAVPDFARALMTAFWPGPLTLIVPRRDGVGAAAAGGQDSIGLRCPAHPLAQAVLSALRSPASGEPVVWGLAAPSANKFGRVSPTLALAMWKTNLAAPFLCWMAAPAMWASNPPSSTAPAASPCCCAPVPSPQHRCGPPVVANCYQKNSCLRISHGGRGPLEPWNRTTPRAPVCASWTQPPYRPHSIASARPRSRFMPEAPCRPPSAVFCAAHARGSGSHRPRTLRHAARPRRPRRTGNLGGNTARRQRLGRRARPAAAGGGVGDRPMSGLRGIPRVF